MNFTPSLDRKQPEQHLWGELLVKSCTLELCHLRCANHIFLADTLRLPERLKYKILTNQKKKKWVSPDTSSSQVNFLFQIYKYTCNSRCELQPSSFGRRSETTNPHSRSPFPNLIAYHPPNTNISQTKFCFLFIRNKDTVLASILCI